MLTKIKAVAKTCCGIILNNRWVIKVSVLLILLGLSYSMSVFAEVDQLKEIMKDVSANFGKDSTAVKLLYGAEIIVGGYTWHKTKNPAAVTGVIILSLFINYAWGTWVSK